MKNKDFDAVKMVRKIRDKSSIGYFSNKKKWLKDLSDLQGVSIQEKPPKRENSNNPTA
ncbi:MAG: hypothetical protein WD048_08845 [Chitinophagales bacterium]